MSSLTPSQGYAAAMHNHGNPHRISLNADHFSSKALPGKTSFTTKRLRKLKNILTPNEFSYYTSKFKGRNLNKEGLPTVAGRGGTRKKRRKKQKSKKKDDQKKLNGKRKIRKK